MKHKFILLLLFIGLLFLFPFSCAKNNEQNSQLSDKQKVAFLISRTLQQTGTLVPAQSLTPEFFRKHYIPKELRKEFVRSYLLLKSAYGNTLDHPGYRRQIIQFLLIKHQHRDLDTIVFFERIRNQAIPENPLFMASSMIMEDMPDLASIGNELYIEQLAISFGVSRLEIIEGIWYYLQNTEIDICRRVALMINNNLYDQDSYDPNFYFQNIMLPFLTYTSMGLVLKSTIEKAVFTRFQETFANSKKTYKGNALYEFTLEFRRYILGGSLHVRYKNNLNKILLRHGLHIFVSKRICVGYKVLDYKIPIQRQGIGDVVFLNKISVSLSINLLGMSRMKEKNVILTMDNYLEHTNNILYTIKNKRPFYSYTEQSLKSLWPDLKTNISLNEADSIYAALIHKEFGSMTKAQIVNALIREIAVHEVKHKWDETGKYKNEWYNVDSETSAHITAILFGEIPYYSLLAFINRYQNFYRNIKIEEVRDKIQPIIVACWDIADQIAQDKIGKNEVIIALRKIHDEYRILVKDQPLPDVDRFAGEIIDPCFRSLPHFDISVIKY